MALSNSVYGSVAIPRIYVDYIQYAKAIGYVEEYSTEQSGDERAAFDMNPVNMNKYIMTQDDYHTRNDIIFKNDINRKGDKQFSLFLQGINYYGLLGHKLAVDTSNTDHVGMIAADNNSNYDFYDWTQPRVHSAILGDPNANASVGYSLYSIDRPISIENPSRLGFYIYKGTSQNQGFVEGDEVSIGSWTCGRYFDFPHNANLQMNINESFDGVKSKRTIGGSDITEILYTKPNWGDLPAWQHIDTSKYINPAEYTSHEDYRTVSNKSRRSWDLTFSYLSKEDTFPKSPDGSSVGEYHSNSGAFDNPRIGTKIKDNIVASFNTLTLGGQVPFLFSPDKTKKDICMCKLRSNGLSIQQASPNLYTAKLSFVEVW